MDNNLNTGFGLIDTVIWMGTSGILLVAHMTQSNITFMMGLIVSILASIYYLLSILKLIKRKK